LIDPVELKTRVVTFTGDNSGNVITFVADDDLTLRQVGMTMGFLSTDPTKGVPGFSTRVDNIYLNSAVNKNWNYLAFPLPRGRSLYWSPTNVIGTQLCSLVFT